MLKMKFRRSILPRTLTDIAASAFFTFIIPVIYWFEVFVVLPSYCDDNGTCYACHCVFSTFLLINVVGNMVAVLTIDCSIRGEVMPSTLRPGWQFCDICECFTPPRSWHCNICQTCILKRDHHCNFTGCCIGHQNQRYFMMFLGYFTLSCVYCTFFNTIYLWPTISFTTFSSVIRLIFPLAMVVFGIDYSAQQLYRFLSVLTIIGVLTGVSLLFYHVDNVLRGRVIYERMKRITKYDMGSVTENLKMAFGRRWYLTWVLPFISSELPHDGINWDKLEVNSIKRK